MKSLILILAACGGSSTPATPDGNDHSQPDAQAQIVEGACQIAGTAPDDLATITCKADFDALAASPFDNALPGATSTKIVLDRLGNDAIYFQNTEKYSVHYAFASTHLSGNGLPIVGDLATFNSTEYFSPDRRFLLGAITYYAQPDKWVLEISPYDTASTEMIAALYDRAAISAYFGPHLYFHPTSTSVAAQAAALPARIPVLTTDDLYAGIDYQPLSLGEAVGRIHFTTAASLAAGEYLSFQDIVVLDAAPNDISVVQGIITQEFQTPLSHVNVLSHARGTTNMGLRDATTNAQLVAAQDTLVKITVGAEAWTIAPISPEDAQAFWDAHAPPPVTLPAMDLTVTAFANIDDVTPEPVAPATLLDALKHAIPAWGGKAAHYSILRRTPNVPIKNGFAIPIYFYDQFMKQNGFYDRVTAMLADPTFNSDPATRRAQLAQLHADMMVAPVDANFRALLTAKAAGYSTVGKLRFRSSSNSEDLDGFPCAGCYESHSGTVTDIDDLFDAVREVYADVWSFRTFEIRSYYHVAHNTVGMALLVAPNYGEEEANGVAVTANPFVTGTLDPAFYVNVQKGGDVEVVAPPAGTTSDQFVYYFDQPNQPIAYITHSNLIPTGTTVLSTDQAHQLGVALAAIRERFSPAYGPAAGNTGWYAMEVDLKFDDEADPTKPPTCYIKQARPYKDPRTTP